ncbi:MAG: hypothetical protein AAFW81_01205 [Pseudomonadota bacterium]
MPLPKCGVIIAVFAMLCGCASSYAPLVISPEIQATEDDQQQSLSQILDTAQELQKDYRSKYINSSRLSDVGGLPLILAAAASAVVILASPSNAAEAAGYIGIGAAGYTAARNTIFPNTLPDLYLEGYAAVACVRDEGHLFVGGSAATAFDNFNNAITLTQRKLADAKFKFINWNLSSGADAEVKERYQQARTNLNRAITEASPIYASAISERNVHDTAETAFSSAVSAISTKVATKGRTGRNVTFDQLIAQFEAARTPAPESESGAQSAAGARDEIIIADLNAAAADLDQAAINLKDHTPSYSTAIERVTKCSNQIS